MGARRTGVHVIGALRISWLPSLRKGSAALPLAAAVGLAACATAPYQQNLVYRASLVPFADCALSSLEKELGPRVSKADLPTTGEVRLAKTVQDAPYVTVTLKHADASQVSANIDILPTLIMRESLRGEVVSALDRCGHRN